jgi:hypothetical protein
MPEVFGGLQLYRPHLVGLHAVRAGFGVADWVCAVVGCLVVEGCRALFTR